MLKPNKAPEPEVLVAMIESIKVFDDDHENVFTKQEKRVIDNLPTKNRILYDMDESQRDIVYRSVKHIWVQMTGNKPEFASENQDAKNLDGAYWMMPGGILLSGFNHFQALKENRNLVCALLNINPLVFEKLLAAGDRNEIIGLVLARGGIRTLIDRDKSEVIMQTNENSWRWAKEKLERMYHKNKIAKVVDLDQQYQGWESGITICVKSTDMQE